MDGLTLSILDRGEATVGGREIDRVRARCEGSYPGFETMHAYVDDGGRATVFFHFAEGDGGEADRFYFSDLPEGTTVEQVVEGFCGEADADLRLTWMTVEHAGGRRHVLSSLPEGVDLLGLEVRQSPALGVASVPVACTGRPTATRSRCRRR